MNSYKCARIEQGKYTQEGACEKLHMSLTRLKSIENEKSPATPHQDEVLAMSELYNKPEMRIAYCTRECCIGKEEYGVEINIEDLFKTGYQIDNSGKFLSNFINELFEILSDGKIDEKETIRLMTYLPKLKEAQRVLKKIELEIEKQNKNTIGTEI